MLSSARVTGRDQEILFIYLPVKIAGAEESGEGQRDGNARIKVRGQVWEEGHRGEEEAHCTIRDASQESKTAQKTMWARTKNKLSQLPDFP